MTMASNAIKNTDRLKNDDLRDELAPATARWLDFLAVPTYGTAMIYGPTQMGKTAASQVFVRKCLDAGVPVIISTDNRTDQLDQFYSRFRRAFACDTTTTILKATDRRFRREAVPVLRGNRRLIVFLLNNASQIDVLRDVLREAIMGDVPEDDVRLPKIVLLHDEGDVVTKDSNVEKIETTQAASHQAWLRVGRLLRSRSVLKRAFLTATPENVVYMYDVERVIRLPVPTSGYVGYQNLQFMALDDVNEAPVRALVSEHRRIRRGAILFCTERVIEEGHDELFQRLCDEVDGVVHTYNGKGIMARCSNPKFLSTIEEVGRDQGLKLKIGTVSVHRRVYRVVGMPIAHFYEACRRLQAYKIVTIGMDLMSRGISFVSSSTGTEVKDTIAATTMIYTPGATMHGVGLVQAIGRITGRACPDLERRLFAPQKVIDDYLKMLRIQTEYLDKIEDTKNSKEDMARIHHRYQMSVSLDRIRLGLKPKYAKRCYRIDVGKHNARARENTEKEKRAAAMEKGLGKENEKIDGVNMAWLKKELKKRQMIGKIVNALQQSELSTNELKTMADVSSKKEEDVYKKILHLGSTSSSDVKGAYGKIWVIEDDKDVVRLNPNIRAVL